MTLFVTMMILILSGSIIFGLLAIGRVFAYGRKYRYPESKYTSLFGFITKEHMVFAYTFLLALNVLVGIWYIFKI